MPRLIRNRASRRYAYATRRRRSRVYRNQYKGTVAIPRPMTQDAYLEKIVETKAWGYIGASNYNFMVDPFNLGGAILN